MSGIDQIVEYSYNERNQRTGKKIDNNADGKFDKSETYLLDANGNWKSIDIDLTNDGTVDQRRVYTKNATDGTEAVTYYVMDNQGVEHETVKDIFYLNEHNKSLAKVHYVAGSDTPAYVERYELDASGRVEKIYRDNNNDGNLVTIQNGKITQINPINAGVDSITTQHYDVYGRVTKRDYDNNADGKIDNNNQYEYDTNGNLVRELQDTNNDGQTNIQIERQFDNFGRQIDTPKYELQNGVPKLVSRYYDYEYDANGQASKYSIDRSGNGLTSDDTTYLFEYDNAGRTVKMTFLRADTKEVQFSVHNLDWDNAGHVTKTWDDRGDNGLDAKDYYSYRTYDISTGKLINSRYVNAMNENQIDHDYTFEYKSDGSYFRTYDDIGGDGQIDRLIYGAQQAQGGTSTIDDFRKWDQAQINKVKGLATIELAKDVTTTITLDSATLAKLSPKGNKLNIWGQSDDNLHISSDFVKSGTKGNHTLYKATIDGTEYTLDVDTAIHTDNVIGG